jgi:hypothetical protein
MCPKDKRETYDTGKESTLVRILLRTLPAEYDQAVAKAKSDVDVRYAQKAQAVAQKASEKAEQSHKSVQGSVTDVERDRLRLEWEKSGLQIEQAQLERQLADLAAKVKEAVAVRRSPDFLIIARTNAIRMYDLDDALRRAELYAKAGADILFVLTRKAEELRAIAERFDMPLMYMPPAGGMVASGLTLADMDGLGIRLVVDAQTPMLALHRALRDSYAAILKGEADPLVGASILAEDKALTASAGLETLLEVERRTVEK